jgi:hypothetical protein
MLAGGARYAIVKGQLNCLKKQIKTNRILGGGLIQNGILERARQDFINKLPPIYYSTKVLFCQGRVVSELTITTQFVGWYKIFLYYN